MKSTYHIDYTLPLNFQPEWAHLFKPDYKYKTVDLRVKELKNVFVNHYGLIIKNGLLVKGCAPNIGCAPFYDKSAYYKHWRKATEQWLVCKYGTSIPSIKLDGNTKYLVIHSPWFSYYFWITECLPRLLMVKDQLQELTLIYPESWKNITFVNETLALFPQLQKIVIPADTHLFVKHLVMPEVKPWTPMFIPELVFEVRELLFKALQEKNITSPFGERIYISRKKAARKKFTDENLADNVLMQYGFDSVCMENYSFFEQIAIMEKANVFTGITGAGHINIIFMPENGCVLDITNKDFITKTQYKFHFYKLCQILKIQYLVSFLNHENSINVNHYSIQNLIFEKTLIEKNLNKITYAK
ncbi:MAG: glycosyltransferase family 61 protein [Bacteroidales bacterium]|nr:glycosyltransferase family 61 protein [Bacteroidales bacterium]